MMSVNSLKRKPEGSVGNVPEIKKQKLGHAGYAISAMGHAMELFDQALAMHKMKKPKKPVYSREEVYQQAQYNAYSTPQSQYYGQQSYGAQSGYGNRGAWGGRQTSLVGHNASGYGGASGMYGQTASQYYQDPYGGYSQQGQQTHYMPSAHKTDPTAINTLHASGFPMGTTEGEIKRLFAAQPGFVALSYQARPGKFPCAWIQFHNIQYSSAARDATDGTVVYGKPIRVGFAKSEMKRSAATTIAGMGSMGSMGSMGVGMYDMKAAYGQAQPQARNTLYITGLAHETQASQLKDMLRNFPGYVGINFIAKMGRAPHAFVLFEDPNSARSALDNLNQQMLNGRPMRVQYAKSEMQRSVAS
mmetsp:Transcript_14243/g.21633  ORF Transcript_14243/g.21633 Transcript_14243/m.21633 type:complete len:359 (-) Transcript_14243:135-1211(-)